MTHGYDISLKISGLSDVRIHDLRHTFASGLINKGRTLYEVQRILGHSSPTVTTRYAHLTQSTLHEAAQTVDAAWGDMTRAESQNQT